MIAQARPSILDEFGYPMPKFRAQPRADLHEMKARDAGPAKREVQAKYEAAQSGDWLSSHWSKTDRLDADSANSRAVRVVLVSRSRHEGSNNGYYVGGLRTYATDVIGTGPKLRMQTLSPGFNAMVEREWTAWTKAILLRRKLHCMAHAKAQDGEGMGVIRQNPGVDHAVKLDVVLNETEQCQTPAIQLELIPGYIDGIKFDEFGNQIHYDLLPFHPGNLLPGVQFSAEMSFEPEKIPARFMLHWFKLERPGQHRGVPECSSTLNIGASSRRMRECTVTAAETAARFGAILETPMPSNAEDYTPDVGSAFSAMEIPAGSLVQLPFGNKATQLKPEHPGATYESFHKLNINELFRPLNMPYGKAAGDHSQYNFASGRMDSLIESASVDIDREDCDDIVLDPLFAVWFREAVRVFSWLGGNPDALSTSASAHAWDWPSMAIADQKAQAIADDKNLRSAATTLPRVYALAGYDFNEEMQAQADAFGMPVEEVKRRIFDALYPLKPDPNAAGSSGMSDMQNQLDEATAQ